MDNAYNQSSVAYETGPKEVNESKPFQGSNKQFPGNKMPQRNKVNAKEGSAEYVEKKYPANPSLSRCEEYR